MNDIAIDAECEDEFEKLGRYVGAYIRGEIPETDAELVDQAQALLIRYGVSSERTARLRARLLARPLSESRRRKLDDWNRNMPVIIDIAEMLLDP